MSIPPGYRLVIFLASALMVGCSSRATTASKDPITTMIRCPAPTPSAKPVAVAHSFADSYQGWRVQPVSEVSIEEVKQAPIDTMIPSIDERYLGSSRVYAHVSDEEIRAFARSVGASRVVVNRSYVSSRWCTGTPPPGWNAKTPISRVRFFAPADSQNVSGYPPQWASACRAERSVQAQSVRPTNVVIVDYDSMHVLPVRDGQHSQVAQIDIAEWNDSLRPALANFAADYGCDRVVLWERMQTSPSGAPPANPMLAKSILLYRVLPTNPKLVIEPQRE